MQTSIFTPVSTQGRDVRRANMIGAISDYSGRVVETVVSSVDGYVMYGIAGPPVKAGGTVATIGLPAKGPP